MVSINDMTLSNSNNNDFKFNKIVEEVFSSLGKEYKFSSMAVENWEASKFESKNLTIEFHRFPGHGPTTYFIDASFNYRGKKMDFTDLISHGNPSLTRIEIEALIAPRNYPAATLEEMRDSLSRT